MAKLTTGGLLVAIGLGLLYGVGMLLERHDEKSRDGANRKQVASALAAAKTRIDADDARMRDPVFARSPAGRCFARHEHDLWTVADCEAIAEHKFRVGMDADQVQASIGPPDHVIHHRYGDVAVDQWVYRSGYLYFEGGVLTSYQTMGGSR